MKQNIQNHPAVEFGRWLKAKRIERRINSRIFAVRIKLTPAEYAEVELGIVHWIKDKQENLICLLLNFSNEEDAEFLHKLDAAREASPLKFEEIFSREELAPARCCAISDEPITPEIKEKILDAVFTPLER